MLLLDNHDDFGGHAKRNEFRLDGRTYLMSGGTLYVEAPSQYGDIAGGLLEEIGIDRRALLRVRRLGSGHVREPGA